MINNRAQKRPLGRGALGRIKGGKKTKTDLFYFITLSKNIMSLVIGSQFKRQILESA